MVVELNNAYSSGWDNVEFPIYELEDGYICITYSWNHQVYNIHTYSKVDFEEEGYEKDIEFNYLFEELTRKHVDWF